MDDPQDQIFPPSSQVPVGRKIVLEFDSFRDFIQQFSPLVSEEGMFVGEAQLEGEPPLVVGDPVHFEVRLSKEFWLIRGIGEIAWRRFSDDPTGGPGVAVRFKRLNEPSRRLLGRLVNNRLKEGGAVFDLEAVPVPAGAVPVVPEPMERSEGDALPGGEELAPGGREEPPIFPVEEFRADEVAAEAVFPVDDIFEPPPIPPSEATGVEAVKPTEPEVEAGPPDDFPGEPLPLPESPESPLQQESLEAVGGEGELEVPVVTHREIAQMTEEISGVTAQGAEEGTEEESSSVMRARAEAAKPERNPWLWLAAASLVGVVLGLAFFFYFPRIKALFGPGEPERVESAVTAESPLRVSDVEPSMPEEETSQGDLRDEDVAVATTESATQAEPPGEASPARVTREIAESQPAVQVPPATRVDRITWREEDGGTVVVVHLNGGLSDGTYEVTRVQGGAPREVIKIFGIREPFRPSALEVGDSRIQQIRTGLHQVDGRTELHIVADLASPQAAISGTRIQGQTLVVTFS